MKSYGEILKKVLDMEFETSIDEMMSYKVELKKLWFNYYRSITFEDFLIALFFNKDEV